MAARVPPRRSAVTAADPGALLRAGRYAEAEARLGQLLRSDPGHAAARYLRAQLNLLHGRLGEAWPDFEARFDIPDWPWRRPPIPPWRGEPLPAQTLVLTMEGGFGDLFQFARFLPMAVARTGQVATDLPTGIAWLFAPSPGRFGRVLGPGETVPAVHRHATIMSLPALFGARLDQLPPPPYLAAEPARIQAWRGRLADGSGRRAVGLVWRAGPDGDPARSLDLEMLAPLARLPGIRLIALQHRPTPDEHRVLAASGIACPEALDADGPFRDTAAILAQLDLLISVDTATAHLAGALGRPVWTLLPHHPDWRWMLGRTDSPWYPAMRLFRQPRAGDWPSVAAAVASALGALAGS